MRPKLTRSETIARNRLDKQISEIHRRRCAGWTINIMNIGQVFAAGYAAAAAGEDVEGAVVHAAATLREDEPRASVTQ
jgi:hypothetical protein